MLEASQFGTGQVFLSMLWFFLFFIWIWLLIVVFGDIFRSDDMSGWAKAGWTIFVIILPYLGVFVYLIARGKKMGEHAAAAAAQQDAASREYIRNAVQSNGSGAADELTRLADLRERGVITDAEFQQAKAKALG
jgi:Short C-terminal domain/Phospholipase_D-nuclease N-terminal